MERRMLKIIEYSTRIKTILWIFDGIIRLKEKIDGLIIGLTTSNLRRFKIDERIIIPQSRIEINW